MVEPPSSGVALTLSSATVPGDEVVNLGQWAIDPAGRRDQNGVAWLRRKADMAGGPPPIVAVRPDDLVVVTFTFENYELVPPTGGGVGRLSPAATAAGLRSRIWIEFHPQAIAEGVSFESTPGFDDGAPASQAPAAEPGATRAGLGFPSRIVVEPPPVAIDYTLEAILAVCAGAVQRLATSQEFSALPDHPVRQGLGATALDLPPFLVLSPGEGTVWKHSPSPVRSPPPPRGPTPARTELWHTRLAPGPQGRTARALWAFDAEPMPGGFSALERRDRAALVARGRDENSAALHVDRLTLSALGGWLDVRGDWEDASATAGSLVSWHHRMAMSRDQYVRLARAGFLFPFGHRAVLVSLTERKVARTAAGLPVAHLRQRMFVLVRNPLMRYPGHRALPFREVRMRTLATPDLAPPVADIEGARDRAFFIQVAAGDRAEDFPFRLVGTDHRGKTVEFSSALAFIDADVFQTPPTATQADRATFEAVRSWIDQNRFAAAEHDGRRRHSLGGARILFGQTAAAAHGGDADPVFDTAMVDVTATLSPGGDPPAPFLPTLHQARARVPALATLAGVNDEVHLRYHKAYLDGAAHPLDLFAELVTAGGQVAPLRVALDRQQGGGLVAPEMQISTLSRALGPLAGKPDDLLASRFDPSSFFEGVPLLLGAVNLKDILVGGVLSELAGTPFPGMVTRETDEALSGRLRWDTTNIKAFGPFVTEGARLSLDVERVAPRGGDEARVTVEGRLENFALALPAPEPADKALVRLRFAALTFAARTGKKLDVSVALNQDRPVEFLGPLRFVNAIAEIIPFGGFEDPPAVDVDASGVHVGYSLPIPTIPIGALMLQNLAFGACFNLPLAAPGSATVTFAVSQRHNPFLVTYSALGGGGFLALEMGLDEIESLEAAIEFGGAMAINLGVASGGASITAGIYYGNKDGRFDLAGFVRCNGVLEVLGLVSVSAQFYLELLYRTGSDPSTVAGTASLRIKVKVVFFSKSVTLTVQREFSKSGDPTLQDALPTHGDWVAYARAFAA